MAVLGSAGLPAVAPGGDNALGCGPAGRPRLSVTGGVDVPDGLGIPADGVVEPPGAGGWLGAVTVAAFGGAGGTLPVGAVAVAAGLP